MRYATHGVPVDLSSGDETQNRPLAKHVQPTNPAADILNDQPGSITPSDLTPAHKPCE